MSMIWSIFSRKKLECLFSGVNFYPIQLFEKKGGAYPRAAPRLSTLPTNIKLGWKRLTRDKHSSLFVDNASDRGKNLQHCHQFPAQGQFSRALALDMGTRMCANNDLVSVKDLKQHNKCN